ncbi:MAG TPA: hypothetical protein VEK05_00730 [Burkholderiales bacterium]|nr:hypothetical protein [Burkholderiales bacterium]
MDQPPRARARIPTRLVIIDVAGVLLAALGLAGLFTELSGPLAFLADKSIAGVTAAAGFALITFAVGNMLRWFNLVRAQRQAHEQRKA